MSNTVRLRHSIHSGNRMLYFYEGEAQVKEGVVELPLDRPEWIKRAWILGYQYDPESGKTLTLEELVPEYVSA